jgi:hypothetical protein
LHGGHQEIKHKPNYVSTMSYTFTSIGPNDDGSPGFSNGLRKPLAEAGVSEMTGVGTLSDHQYEKIAAALQGGGTVSGRLSASYPDALDFNQNKELDGGLVKFDVGPDGEYILVLEDCDDGKEMARIGLRWLGRPNSPYEFTSHR